MVLIILGLVFEFLGVCLIFIATRRSMKEGLLDFWCGFNKQNWKSKHCRYKTKKDGTLKEKPRLMVVELYSGFILICIGLLFQVGGFIL